MKIVAENLQALNPPVASALEHEDVEALQKLTRAYEQAGAEALDINPGYSRKNAAARMKFMVEAVQEVSSLPLFLDSPQAEVVEAGLKSCRNQAIINFVTLEKERIESFFPLAAEYGVPIVAAVMEKQPPVTAEEKLVLASRLIQSASEFGVPAENLIFDPILIPLGWGDGPRYARETLRFLDLIPQVLEKTPQTLVGLSNLTTRAAGAMDRQGLQSVFLSMLAAHELTYALINITRARLAQAIKMIRAFTEDRPFSPAEFPEE